MTAKGAGVVPPSRFLPHPHPLVWRDGTPSLVEAGWIESNCPLHATTSPCITPSAPLYAIADLGPVQATGGGAQDHGHGHGCSGLAPRARGRATTIEAGGQELPFYRTRRQGCQTRAGSPRRRHAFLHQTRQQHESSPPRFTWLLAALNFLVLPVSCLTDEPIDFTAILV